MHSRPESTEKGATFDLGAIAREMREEETYARGGQAGRTLVREPDLRVVLMVLKAGAHIKEHKADGSASVQVLSGALRLHLSERVVELSAGQLLVMERGLPHDVEADSESAFLLTLGWSG